MKVWGKSLVMGGAVLSATLLLGAIALFPGEARAQGGSGEIIGIVYDPSGAAVPGASVVLSNAATGLKRDTATNAAGLYVFPNLSVVGTYKIRVQKEGFRVFEAADIVVSVGRAVAIDVHLELGATTQVVTVEAGVQLVQTTESQLSELVDRRAWQSLPLEFRDTNVFINLLPGTVPDDFGGTTRGAAVSGARPGMGNFLVEGYDNNDQGQGGRGATVSGAITSISPEAIQEYRIISHVYAAEYGKGGAFVTDTVLKSGTNDYHGAAFWYNRVQALAANSFFSNKAGIQDALVRNQFGGSFGGPLLPALKDKTFFFVSYEGHIRRQASPLTGTATTQEFLDFVRRGAFATFHESNSEGLCVVNNGAPCPGAFANSRNFGPIFTKLLASQPFPLAKASSTPCSPPGTPPRSANTDCLGAGFLSTDILYPVHLYGTITLSDPNHFDQHRGTVKVDHKLSSKDQLSGTFLMEDLFSTDILGGADATFGVPLDNPARRVLIGVTYTRTFTPTIINQARIGYLRDRSDFPNHPGTEGIPSVVTAFDPLAVGFGQTSNLPQFFTDNQFQYKDDLSFVHGKHAFKAGGEYRRIRNGSSFQALKNGLFEPYGVEELVTDGFFGDEGDRALGTNFGGFFAAEASINPLTGKLPEFYRGYRENEFAAYFQDDWRIHPHFTINVGLRWEYFGPPHNFRKGIDANFYFGSAITPIPVTTTNIFYPKNDPGAARVFNGAVQQRDHEIWAKDTNNFAPRLGFAWDILGNQKLILRGGGGVFYDRIWNNLFENIRFNPPFFAFALTGTLQNGVPIGPLSSPGVYTSPFTSTSAFARFGLTPSLRHMNQDLVTAYNEQFYLGTQWAFAPSFVLEVDGVGTLGRKLHGVIDNNTYNGRTACSSSSASFSNRARCDAFGRRTGFTFSTRRVNTAFSGDNFRTNLFSSSYYGLQVVVRKSFSHGLQFNANYTWAHAIDEVSDAFNNARGAILRPTDNSNPALDRGNADFDIRHRLVMSYYYELPWMKNNRWVGGWSFSGITNVQTGVPIQLYDSSTKGDANRDGYNTDRLVFSGSGNINDAVQHDRSPANGYFNAALFKDTVCPATVNNGLWCNSPTGRNTLIGPGFVNFDFSVAKKFKVTERLAFQFQASFFNIFNHPNFRQPVGNLNDPNFGKSLATFDPRITQLSLRLDF